MRDISEVLAWAREHPVIDGGRQSWVGLGGKFIYVALDLARAYETVDLAFQASGTPNPSPQLAPKGAIHWWESAQDGMAGIDLDGGGTDILGATNYGELQIGDGVSVFSWSKLTGRLPGYHGWTLSYGLNPTAVSKEDVTAILGHVPAAPGVPKRDQRSIAGGYKTEQGHVLDGPLTVARMITSGWTPPAHLHEGLLKQLAEALIEASD